MREAMCSLGENGFISWLKAETGWVLKKNRPKMAKEKTIVLYCVSEYATSTSLGEAKYERKNFL